MREVERMSKDLMIYFDEDGVAREYDNTYDITIHCESEEEIQWALEKLPSAQPERQKGEWIDYTEDGYVECPFCHNATNCDGNKDELHFCFSCGADMRKDEQE